MILRLAPCCDALPHGGHIAAQDWPDQAELLAQPSAYPVTESVSCSLSFVAVGTAGVGGAGLQIRDSRMAHPDGIHGCCRTVFHSVQWRAALFGECQRHENTWSHPSVFPAALHACLIAREEVRSQWVSCVGMLESRASSLSTLGCFLGCYPASPAG